MSTYPTKERMANREREHELAYKLLKYALVEEYGLRIDSTKIWKNDYGKPYLPESLGIYFNISHCDGMVACGISEKEIGIDIETIHSFSDKIVQRVFTQGELSQTYELAAGKRYSQAELLTRIWTLKESYVKAVGMGFSIPLKSVEFLFGTNLEILCNQPGFLFYQHKIMGHAILSVCKCKE